MPTAVAPASESAPSAAVAQENAQEWVAEGKVSEAPVERERLGDVLQELATVLAPHGQGLGVAGTDGLGIAFQQVSGVAAEMLGAQMALILQLGRRAAQRLEGSGVEEVLVTTGQSYLLGLFLEEGTHFVVVSARRTAGLGHVRAALRHFAPRVARAISNHDETPALTPLLE